MNNSQPIGTATMEYSESGQIVKAIFTPSMVVNADDFLLGQLEAIRNEGGPAELKSSADLVMSAWFSKTNEIELADREKWFIDSKVKSCTTHPNGKVKKCILEYCFKLRA